MALKTKGRKPAATAKAETATEDMTVPATMAKAKLTVSVKRRMANGDEVFIAPGIELDCTADGLDAAQEEVSTRVHGWLDTLLSEYPDSDPIEDDEDEAEDDEEDEDEADDEEAEDEDDLTEDDVRKMKKADLVKLAADYKITLKSKSVGDMRDELIAALFEEDEDDEDGDDEDEADEADEDEDDESEDEADDEDEDHEDGDDEDEDAYTEEELSAMKLGDLQEIMEAWELKHPKLPKDAKLAAKKKAYIKAILDAQE
jgi:hypothetical protein